MTISEANVNPCLRKVGNLTGPFFIPAYQRGYRWGDDEVTRSLS